MTLAIAPVPGTDEKSHVKQNIAIQQLFKNVGYMTNQRQTMTLEEFDVVGDGNTDDAAKIIIAFTTARAAGARLLGGPGKTYKLVGTGPQMAFEGVHFDGQDCTFDLRNGPVNGLVFNFSQQATHTVTTIAADIAIGDETITLTSVVGMLIGDWLQFSVTLASTGNTYGFVAPITAIVGSAVTISTSMPIAINHLLDANTVNAVLPSRGTFRNTKFIGTNITNSATAIIFQYSAGIIENLRFLDCRGDTSNGGGIYINYCYDLSVKDISLQNSGTGGRADFTAISSNCNYDGVTSDRAYGFGPQWQQGCFNNVANVISAKSTGRGVKLAGQVLSNFSNINIQQSTENGLVVSVGTQRCTFNNIVSVNTTGVALNQHGIWLSDQTNTDNIFVNFKALNNVDADIFVGASDTGCHFSNGSYGSITNDGLAALNNVNGIYASSSATVTLVNGDNNNVVLPAGNNVRVIGPTADFSINGVVAGQQGQEYFIFNGVNHIMTIKNQNAGSDAANRIFTAVGDYTPAVAFSSFTIKYDGQIVSWLVKSKNG